jgi:hypothetical protein
MNQALEQKPAPFIDRRAVPDGSRPEGPERRQFQNSHASERPEVAELAQAVDCYKLQHRRRFITYAELYRVIEELGYHK